jgi:hypothetical protein
MQRADPSANRVNCFNSGRTMSNIRLHRTAAIPRATIS